MEKISRFPQFFYIYHVLVVISSLLVILDQFLNPVTGPIPLNAAQSNPLMFIVGGIVSILSIAVFILSIVALVQFRKRRLPRITLVVPIVRIVGSFFLVLAGAIIGVMVAREAFSQMGQSATPDQVASLFADSGISIVLRWIAPALLGFQALFSLYLLLRFRSGESET